MLLLVVQNPINLHAIDDSVSLDSINDFFQTVAISSKHQSADSCVLPACGTGDFSFDRISISTVLSHLSTLDVSKSTGPDGLSAAFLREVANEIAVPLTNLYNQSLHNGFIPVGWKQSHITLVYVTRFAKTRHNSAFFEIHIFTLWCSM